MCVFRVSSVLFTSVVSKFSFYVHFPHSEYNEYLLHKPVTYLLQLYFIWAMVWNRGRTLLIFWETALDRWTLETLEKQATRQIYLLFDATAMPDGVSQTLLRLAGSCLTLTQAAVPL